MRPEVERVEDGHPVFPPEAFAGGETLHFSFYVKGFTRKENKVKLRFEARSRRPDGRAARARCSKAMRRPRSRPKIRNGSRNFAADSHFRRVLCGGAYRISGSR